MANATMARMMKKTIKMTAMTMFRFVIFFRRGRWGREKGSGRPMTRRSGGERRGE